MKKMGVFQRNLILTLGISISLLVIIIMLFNYTNARSDFKEDNRETEQLVEENILNAVQSSDVAYSIIENSLAEKMEKYTNTLMDLYKKNPNIDTWDLNRLKKQFDGYEIFVLNKDLVITHSSRKADLGLDFKEFGITDLLNSRMESGKFETDRLEVSEATKQANKFSYMATPDKKYLIELGATSEQFDGQLKDLDLAKMTENLAVSHPYVGDILLYTVQDNGVPEHSVNKQDKAGKALKISAKFAKIGEQAMKSDKIIEKVMTIKGNAYKYRFIPVLKKDTDGANLYKQSRLLVIQYDEGYFHALLAKKNIMSIIIVLVSVMIAVILSVVIGRRVSKPIREFGLLIDRTSQLEFTDNAHLETLKKRKDDFGELAQKYDSMLRAIRNAFAKVVDSASQLAGMSEQFNTSSKETKQAAEQIAQSIHEVSKETDSQSAIVQNAMDAIVSITTEVKRVSDNMQEVNTLVSRTVEISNTGQEAVDHSASNMQKINTYTKDSKDVVIQLNDKSTQIENISSFITSIAEQTNLLALNAAIESARAGEAGKGFAVVADEVRKLAVESSKAAKQINELIAQIKGEVSKAMDSMNLGYEAVQEGNELTEEAGQAFREILGSVEEASGQSKETASISKQVEQITTGLLHSVQQISELYGKLSANAQEVAATTEQQTAIVEDMSDGASHLSSIAESMISEVEKFKVN